MADRYKKDNVEKTFLLLLLKLVIRAYFHYLKLKNLMQMTLITN